MLAVKLKGTLIPYPHFPWASQLPVEAIGPNLVLMLDLFGANLNS